MSKPTLVDFDSSRTRKNEASQWQKVLLAKFEKCKFGEIGQLFFCKRHGKIEMQYVETFKAEYDLVSGHMPLPL